MQWKQNFHMGSNICVPPCRQDSLECTSGTLRYALLGGYQRISALPASAYLQMVLVGDVRRGHMRQQSALHDLIRMWHPLIHLGRPAQGSRMFSKAHGHSFPDDCQIQTLEQGSGVSVGGEDGGLTCRIGRCSSHHLRHHRPAL